MPSAIYHRDTCRLCLSRDVVIALPLVPTPIADQYLPKGRLDEPQPVIPIDLYLCRSCGHVQVLDVIPPEILFKDYIYVSASSLRLDEHFQKYADDVIADGGLKPGMKVMDIGSNDGTLLRFFKKKGFLTLGVDPATEIAKQATVEGIETIPAFFTAAESIRILKKYGKMDLVTANNVFAHADDMGDVATGIQNILAPNGIFVFEVSYLLDLMEGMVFDYTYHEHLCHHSVKPLKKFLARHGLELIHVQRVPTKGGSIRGTAQLTGGPKSTSSSVAEFIKTEDAYGLEKIETFNKFAIKIEKVKKEVLALIDDLIAKGKKIGAYGASATSTTLIYHFDLGRRLPYIIDDNPQRQNLFSPGFHLPVLSPNEIPLKKPDYIVILAWRYAEPIMKKHRSFLEQGGHFIIPLPSLQVV